MAFIPLWVFILMIDWHVVLIFYCYLGEVGDFHPSELLVFCGRPRMTRNGSHGVRVYQEITVAGSQFALEFGIPPGVPLLRFLMIRVLTWIAFGFSVYCGKCDTLNIIL
jgi:hypothetical protein